MELHLSYLVATAGSELLFDIRVPVLSLTANTFKLSGTSPFPAI